MDRRSFLKSTGIALGGLTAASLVTTGQAATGTVSPTAKAAPLSAENPLLLNFNENSLGMSPKARQAIIDALPGAFRYPDAAREALIEQIAAHFSLTPEHISLGNGSSETIQAAVQMLVADAQKKQQPVQLIVPDPTFNYAELYAEPLGVNIVKVPLKADLSFDLAAMQAIADNFAGHSVIYICNPNNPTAMITPASQLAQWVNQAPPQQNFIIDEAYAEFVSDPQFKSAVEWVAAGKSNIIVTRTFSKIFALAGLRVGYGISVPAVTEQVNNFNSIDNTNIAGAVSALASLNDKPFIDYSRHSTDVSREIVVAALKELNLPYAPSQANFIFHKVTGDVKTYQQRMKENHIMVGREFPPVTGWSRLTLGTPEEMQQFVAVLKQFRQKGWV